MEFCGDQCTLDRISRETSGLPEKIVRYYTKSLLKAVEALHENKGSWNFLLYHFFRCLFNAMKHLLVMHRDIKGANIFLKAIDQKHPERIVLKLGDFGCSIKFKDMIGSNVNRAKATGFMGTFRKFLLTFELRNIFFLQILLLKAFMAPEVMICGGAVNADYTYSADIWSLGCVVIEMFTGKRPWHPLSDETILFKVHLGMKYYF